MQDNYGRNVEYLRLSVTDSCDYRCIYCMDGEVVNNHCKHEILSIDELVNIGRAAVECGIKKIRITGGEPLVRKDLLDICKELKSIKGLNELAITTNGARLSQMAQDLKAVGIDRLNISLDTLNRDKFSTITRTGNLSDVLNGIEEANKAGFENTKINVVLMNGINDDEIDDFVNLTKDNPISVRFIELMPMGPSRQWYDTRFISTDVVKQRIPELTAIGQDGASSVYRLENALGTVGLISPISQCFCSECNRLRVTADGRLLPCLHSALEYNVRGLSGEELIEAFNTAIKNKPESHHIIENHASNNSGYMNAIGG